MQSANVEAHGPVSVTTTRNLQGQLKVLLIFVEKNGLPHFFEAARLVFWGNV